MTNTKFNAYTAVKLQCDFDYVCRGTCNEREVPCANGRAAAGSAADFLRKHCFLANIVFVAIAVDK